MTDPKHPTELASDTIQKLMPTKTRHRLSHALLRPAHHVLSTCAAAMILFGLSGCATQYERGMRAINEQRWDDAKHQARQGMAHDVNAPEYHLLMAEALVGEAMALYAQEQSDGSSPPVELQKAQKRYREALPHAQKAFDSGQLDARAGRILGKIYYELNRPIDTAFVWQRARQADPLIVSDEDYVVAVRTGLLEAVSLEDSERALTLREEFKRILAQKPELLEAQTPRDAAMFREAISQEAFRRNRQNLAQDKVKQRKYADAIALYIALVTDYPDESIYHFQLGRLYLQQGKEAEAITAFEAYINAPEPKQRLQRMRKVASRAEQVSVRSVAMLFYTKMLDELGDTPSDARADILLKLARINLIIGDIDPAKEHLHDYLDDLRVTHGTKLLNTYIAQLLATRPHQLADVVYNAPTRLSNALAPPLHASIYTNIATTATQHGQFDMAIELLELAVANARVDFSTTKRLGELYARKAQTGDVERVLKLYVERRGGSESALRDAARWSLQRLNYDLAQFFFEQLVQRGFAQAKDYEALARIYGQQGQLEELKRSLETYLELSTNSHKAMATAARFYMTQRLYEEAEALLLEAQKKHPTSIDFPKELAKLYRDWDKPDKIDDAYEPWLVAKGRRPVDLVTVGNNLTRSHDPTTALPYFIEAAKKGEYRAWMQAARVYRQYNREADMKRALDAYVEASSDRVSALTEVLSYYNSASNDDEAIRVLEELVELQTNVPNDQIRKLTGLYLDQGRERDAYDLCSDYLRTSRRPYTELKTIASFFTRRNRPDRALELYQQLLERGTVDARAYQQIGDLLISITKHHAPRIGLTPQQARTKALDYYTRYFEEVDVTGADLRSFAQQLHEKKFYELAERAYSKHIEGSSRAQPNALYQHASVLLELDQTARAVELFARFYAIQNKASAAAMSVATALSRHNHYALAEPYLLDVLDSRDTKNIEQAFEKLATIYHETDRADQFSPLIKKYISRSANPANARATITRAAEKYGQWEIAIEQYEELSRARDSSGQQHIAEHLWRMGKREESIKRWDQWASAQTTTKGLSYTMAAIFMEEHLEPELAMTFLDKAINTSPESYVPYAQRGRLRLLTAEVELGAKDFERALAKADAVRREEVLINYITTLHTIGHYKRARAVARDALKRQGINKTPLLLTLANEEFTSQDDVRIDRMLTDLKQSGASLQSVITALVSAQLYERATTLLEEEVANGDYILAGELMLEHADVFTRLGGVDRLMRAVQPLLDRHRDSRLLEEKLGRLLIQEGHLERGAIFLRVAVDAGHHKNRLALAHTNLLLGRHTEAHRLFFDELANIPTTERPAAVKGIATRYITTGKDAELNNLLEHMMRDERFVLAATPFFVSHLLNDEGIISATNYLRRVIEDKPTESEARASSMIGSRSENLRHELSLLGIKEIAAHGYLAEAHELLDSYPRAAQNSTSYRSVRLMLDVIDPTRDYASALEAKLGPLPRGASTYPQPQATELLYTAHNLLIANKPDDAKALAEPYLTDLNTNNANLALKLLVTCAFIQDQPDQIDDIIATFIDARSDKAIARENAITLLIQLGMNLSALDLIEQNYESNRSLDDTQLNLDQAFLIAPNAHFERYVERAKSVLDRPRAQLRKLALKNINNPSSPLPTESFQDVLRTSPNNATLQAAFALHDYWAGDVASARQRWLEYLERTGYDEAAIEDLLADLVHLHLDMEVVGAILPSLPQEHRSHQSRYFVGISLAALGRTDEAREQFDAYIKESRDASLAAYDIADALGQRDIHQLSSEYAELAIRKDPTRPSAYRWRALARIRSGDIEGARADLERCLGAGHRAHTLDLALDTALEAGHVELATELSTQITQIIPEPSKESTPIYNAITSWSNSSLAKDGLTHIETVAPSLFETSPTNTGPLAAQIAVLRKRSGATTEALNILVRRRQQAIARSRVGEVYQLSNTLAWLYALADTELDRAEHLSRLSIALAGQHTELYFDTLGWIYYKRGDHATALELIDKSLRLIAKQSTEGYLPSMHQHDEYIHHSVILKDQLGHREKSTWLQIILEQSR